MSRPLAPRRQSVRRPLLTIMIASALALGMGPQVQAAWPAREAAQALASSPVNLSRARVRELLRNPALTRSEREALRASVSDFVVVGGPANNPGAPQATEDGIWQYVPAPTSRAGHSAIYDPVRQRMIVYGGSNWYGGHRYLEVWTQSLRGVPTWTQIQAQGSGPTFSTGHVAIHDPLHDRMIVLGPSSSELWALSLGLTPRWTLLATAGIPPGGVLGTTAYDPVRHRMLVFTTTSPSDVWSLSLAETPTWTRMTPAGTPPSGGASNAIYDPVADRIVFLAGVQGEQLWALSLDGVPSWSTEATHGPAPEVQSYPTIYDPRQNRMIVFGDLWGPNRNEVWALSLGKDPTWTELVRSGASPNRRSMHTAIYDSALARMIVFGGENPDAISLGDTWALALQDTSAWSYLDPVGTPPAERGGHTSIHDPVRDRMVVFGGRGEPGSDYVSTRALKMRGTPSWIPMGAGLAPGGREGHTAIHDPVRERMIVFGGWYQRNDVWSLPLGGRGPWTELSPAGTPPSGRSDHSAIYDPVRRRMVVFGGNGLSDVWALSLDGTPNWTELFPVGSPPIGRRSSSAIYDPVRDRMVVFGGWAQSYGELNDVWALSLAGTPTWTQLLPEGTAPSERSDHSAIYDPVRDRMVVFGGTWGPDNLWALSLGETPTWTPLATTGMPERQRCGHTATYDPMRDRMMVFGGTDCDLIFWNDVWTLSFSRQALVTSEPPALPDRFALYGPRPNPLKPGGRIGFGLSRSATVQLRVFDLGGRLVTTLVNAWMPAGRHEVPWAARDMPSGVYFLEMRSGPLRESRPIVLTR